MIKLGSKIRQLAESETLAMTVKARNLKAQGKDVISLSIGEPDLPPPKEVLDRAQEAIVSGQYHSYPPVDGYLDLKQAICRKFKTQNQLEYTPDQIVVSTGAKQSLYNLMQVILDAGDEVLLPAPYWVSYRDMATLAGAKVVEVPATIATDFKINPEQLASLITSKTRMFIFSNPCNPSGQVYSGEELREIARVLSRHQQILIVSDEIYEHINYTGKPLCSMGSFAEVADQTATVNGLAKGFAMPGWRIGYIGAPSHIASACRKLQGQVTSGANTIAQRAAIAALEMDVSQIDHMRVCFQDRRDFLLSELSKIEGFKVQKPQGAFYVFPDVSHFFGTTISGRPVENAKDFCGVVLDVAHVALVSGSAFGVPSCVRFSYAVSKDILKEAVRRIKAIL